MRPIISRSSLPTNLYRRIHGILESTRHHLARSVNTTQVISSWLIGREIIEEEQKGEGRAAYGARLLDQLSRRLTKEFGRGYSRDNLEGFRLFYLGYPTLISETPSRKFPGSSISETVSRKSGRRAPAGAAPQGNAAPGETPYAIIKDAAWKPGKLHPNLAWSIYRLLLKVHRADARAFYEIEAIKNNWSARELERQIASLLFERLARSRDKQGLMRLAIKGQKVLRPADAFKDPIVMEFLGIPSSTKLVETDVEAAMTTHLQTFLLELGKGFAFVSRQERISLNGDHFYVDLVFYHTVLKCYVLLDLKVGKLSHSDLGQLQLYVNYFDRTRRTRGDKPTVGLILCTDKNDAVVQYTLGADQQKRIFARQYKLHLPSTGELQTQLRHLPLSRPGGAGPAKFLRPAPRSPETRTKGS